MVPVLAIAVAFGVFKWFSRRRAMRLRRMDVWTITSKPQASAGSHGAGKAGKADPKTRSAASMSRTELMAAVAEIKLDDIHGVVGGADPRVIERKKRRKKSKAAARMSYGDMRRFSTAATAAYLPQPDDTDVEAMESPRRSKHAKRSRKHRHREESV